MSTYATSKHRAPATQQAYPYDGETPPPDDYLKLKRRYEAARSNRSALDVTYDKLTQFVAPYRGEYFTDAVDENGKQWSQPQVFDSTAPVAAQNLAAAIHAGMSNPAMQWFQMRFGSNNAELNEDKDAREWAEACTAETYRALNDSNFNLEVGEAYFDMVVYAQSPFMTEEVDEDKWKGMAYTALPVHETYFEEGFNGRPVAVFRRLEKTPAQMVEAFGDAGVPQAIRDLAADPDAGNNKRPVIYAIWRRVNIDAELGTSGKVLASTARPYACGYFCGMTGYPLGVEHGFYTMPVALPRWRKTANSQNGNSPAMTALGTIMSLNKTIELSLISLEKEIDPPMKTTERGVIGDVHLEAGGLTVVRKMDDLEQLRVGAQSSRPEMKIEDMRRAIQQYFYVDQLELKESPAMTAAEVQVRYELMQRLLGSTHGRITVELLEVVVQNTFYCLYRAGKLPKMPQSVINAKAALDVQFVGALARAQNMDNVIAVERWLGYAAQLKDTAPETSQVPDYLEIMYILGRKIGVPERAMRDIKAVRADIEQSKKMAQERATADTAEVKGRTMKAAASAMDLMGDEGGEVPSPMATQQPTG